MKKSKTIPTVKVAKQTARELVTAALIDTPLNTTDGIQRTLVAHDGAIKALADRIDGKR